MHLLEEASAAVRYPEAFINVGRKLYPIIEGVEKVLPCAIIRAHGRDIGPKAAHMKAWILETRA